MAANSRSGHPQSEATRKKISESLKGNQNAKRS